MANLVYLTIGVFLFLVFSQTTQDSSDLIQDEYTSVMTSKATAFHVMNYFQVDQLKGNYITLISSSLALVLSVVVFPTMHRCVGLFLVIVSTLVFHVSFLTLQTSENALPISSVLEFTISTIKQPVTQVPKTLLSFFTVLSSVFPKTQQYFQVWIFNLENTTFPPILLILIACGLMHKKLQMTTLLFIPFIVTLVVGIPILFLNLNNNPFVQLELFVAAFVFIVSFVNGALQMEKLFLSPLFFIATVLFAKNFVNILKGFTILSSLQRDFTFVLLYLTLFCLVFYKKFAYSFVPTLLVFCAVESVAGFNIQIDAMVPIFFVLHGLFE